MSEGLEVFIILKEKLENFFSKSIGDLVAFEKPITCPQDFPMSKLIEILSEKNIGSMIVADQNQPIGIVTERDIVKRVAGKINDLENAVVSDYMTLNPICIRPSTPLNRIMAAMRMGKFRHLIITNDTNKIVGMVSMKDVLYSIDSFIRENLY